MGVTIIQYVSLYTFLMGVLWFSIFVLLSLFVRKLKYPIRLSTVPLAVLLTLSFVRILVPIKSSATIIIESEVIFPAVMRFLRFELIPFTPFGFPVNVLHIFFVVWGAGSVVLLIKHLLLRWRALKLTDKLTAEPDEEANAILAEITGSKVKGYVFRIPFETPATSGYKPHIYLPKGVDFTQGELHAILKHEWKHIQSKDYLIDYFVNLICCIFWWNPLVYVLKNNVYFAQEASCDVFTIKTMKDLKYFTNALLRLHEEPFKEVAIPGNAFVNLKNPDLDRYELLALRFDGKPRKKRVFAHVCFYLAVGALFLSSYMFIILPAHWGASGFEHIDCIEQEPGCFYSEESYQRQENFLVDNGDGTFSLYVDGQYLADGTAEEVSQEAFQFLPVITRKEWERRQGDSEN